MCCYEPHRAPKITNANVKPLDENSGYSCKVMRHRRRTTIRSIKVVGLSILRFSRHPLAERLRRIPGVGVRDAVLNIAAQTRMSLDEE